MNNLNQLVHDVDSKLKYSVNRAIITGKILVNLNDSTEIFSSVESFINACLAYTDPKHKRFADFN